MNTLEEQLDDLVKTADKLKQAHEKLVSIPEVFAELGVHEDPVNPDHYKNQTSLECIEAMEIIFGRDAVIDFCRCNAWKYIWRWKNKNGVEDLDKAKWYLERTYSMLSGDDKRTDIVRGMIHYVNKNIVKDMIHCVNKNEEESNEVAEINKIITPDEFYLKMKDTELKYHDDPEDCHWQLDNLMCDTLESLGYGSGVEIFLESGRWYS